MDFDDFDPNQTSSSDEEDNSKLENEFKGKSGVIFLVDAREAMFHDEPDGKKCLFRQCLETIRSIMITVCRLNRRDSIGIVLFGVERTNGDEMPLYVCLLQKLSGISVEKIEEINDLIVSNFVDIRSKYGSNQNKFMLSRALRYSQSLLHKSPNKLHKKSILLFTYEDNPFKKLLREQHHSRKQSLELFEHKINLEVISLVEDFNSKHFYKELILNSRGLLPTVDTDPVLKLENLETEVLSIFSKLSRTMRNLRLGNKMLPCVLYRLYSEPSKRVFRYENPKTGVDKSTTAINTNSEQDNNGETSVNKEETELVPQTVNAFPMLGGKIIQINKTELKEKRFKTGPGLTLLGFVPTDYIPEYYNIGCSLIVVPNYKFPSGISLFSHLLARCLAKKMSLICWYMYNSISKPVLTALHPTTEDESTPACFTLIKLPFEDTIIEPEDQVSDNVCVATKDQIEAADQIIKKLSIHYKPEVFHDYEYKLTMAKIEALALGYDEPEHIDDDTDIDLKDISERLGDLSEKFLTYPEEFKESLKRNNKTNGNLDGPKSKITRVESLDDIKEVVFKKKAETLSTTQLRSLLKEYGLTGITRMRKDELIQNVYERLTPM